jgi:hypothetical protein
VKKAVKKHKKAQKKFFSRLLMPGECPLDRLRKQMESGHAIRWRLQDLQTLTALFSLMKATLTRKPRTVQKGDRWSESHWLNVNVPSHQPT